MKKSKKLLSILATICTLGIFAACGTAGGASTGGTSTGGSSDTGSTDIVDTGSTGTPEASDNTGSVEIPDNTGSTGAPEVPVTYTVKFVDADDTVISEKTYEEGAIVDVPEDPKKEADNTYTYAFAGWDKTVVDCAGNATYTAQFVTQEEYESMTATETETESATEQNSAASGCTASVSAIPCFAAALAVAIFSFKRKKH
jgi:hypothetical protein